MGAKVAAMFPAMLLAAWLTTAGSCSSSPTGTDGAPTATGVAGKGSGGTSGRGGSAGGAAGTSSPGSGGNGGAGCAAQCQPGQTCCYDRTGKVQCLPAGAVCTG